MGMIDLHHLTKDYGNHKGIFDLSFSIEQGEVFGFLGPNGAGKTTTIRILMGFIRPQSGNASIHGLDCFKQSDRIMKSLGYLPGEIAFMENMTGIEFLHFIGKMKNMRDFNKAEELIRYFDLDPKGKIKKMSKGMKQKIGIISAFMNKPDILLLDEPTSGLDPLMQNRFIELVRHEKERGATILMSSHLFEEVERTCDRTAFIKEGSIVAIEQMKQLRERRQKTYQVSFASIEDAKAAAMAYPNSRIENETVTFSVSGETDRFIKHISRFQIQDIDVKTQTLEEMFLHLYGGRENDQSDSL